MLLRIGDLQTLSVFCCRVRSSSTHCFSSDHCSHREQIIRSDHDVWPSLSVYPHVEPSACLAYRMVNYRRYSRQYAALSRLLMPQKDVSQIHGKKSMMLGLYRGYTDPSWVGKRGPWFGLCFTLAGVDQETLDFNLTLPSFIHKRGERGGERRGREK